MTTRQFKILESIRQGVFVLGVLVLVEVIGGIGSFFLYKLTPLGIINLFIFGTIIGPIPALLTHFDITDAQLMVWAIILLIPYWVALGMIAGHFRWRERDASFPPVTIGVWAWLREKHGMEPEQAALFKQEIRNFRIVIVALAAAVAMLSFVAGPPLAWNGRNSIRFKIVNNLRQLELAKAMLASDENLKPDYTPTADQLVKYLGTTNFLNPTNRPVRYVINAIDAPPYAVLEADWRIPRKGWQQGYTLTNGMVIKLR